MLGRTIISHFAWSCLRSDEARDSCRCWDCRWFSFSFSFGLSELPNFSIIHLLYYIFHFLPPPQDTFTLISDVSLTLKDRCISKKKAYLTMISKVWHPSSHLLGKAQTLELGLSLYPVFDPCFLTEHIWFWAHLSSYKYI